MNLLKKDNWRDEHRLVGTSLTLRVYNYLTLYSLAKGISKARLIKKLLESWMDVERLQSAETKLTHEIADQLNRRWKSLKSHNSSTFIEFTTSIKSELTKKGVKDTYILLILSEIKE